MSFSFCSPFLLTNSSNTNPDSAIRIAVAAIIGSVFVASEAADTVDVKSVDSVAAAGMVVEVGVVVGAILVVAVDLEVVVGESLIVGVGDGVGCWFGVEGVGGEVIVGVAV
jgi:hypothetical protein